MKRFSNPITLNSLSFAVLVSVLPTLSFAASSDGNFAARGIGAQSCVNLTTALAGETKEVTSIQLGAWVAGYLSHANRVTAGTYDIMPIQNIYGVATILARICDRNPQSLIEPAMDGIVSVMRDHTQPTDSPLSVVENEGKEIAVRQAVLRDAQRLLIAQGYLDTGNDDGAYGPKTRDALSQFQQSKNLEANGLPDALTLFVLFDSK